MEVPCHRDRAPSVEDVRRVLDRKRKPADDSGQRAINPGLIVNACGHTVFVPEGNSATLLLKHVQRTLQDGLDMQSAVFEIYDRTGIRLRTDQDARDAVRSGRTPFHATCDSRCTSEIEWMCRSIGGLKSELENQKQEYKMEFECLRNALSSAVEAFKSELHTASDLLQAARAEVADTGSSSPGGQLMVMNLEQGMPLATTEQLLQLQKEFCTVSKHMQDDLQSMSSKVHGVSALVKSSLEGYSLCTLQHTETIQTKDAMTKLAGQCETFHARLSNVERSVHDVFLDQLKRDADIIPESIREWTESPPPSPGQVLRADSQPLRLEQHSLVDSRTSAGNSIAVAMHSTQNPRAVKVVDSADRASQSTPPSVFRGQPNPTGDHAMFPLPVSTRSSARSSSPRRDKMDCTRSLTVSESPTRRRRSSSKSRVPTSPTEERAHSREQRELAARELASLSHSASPQSSAQSLPSKPQAIRMQSDRSGEVQSAFAIYSPCAVQPVSAPTDDGMTKKKLGTCQPAPAEEIVFRGRLLEAAASGQRVGVAEPSVCTSSLGPSSTLQPAIAVIESQSNGCSQVRIARGAPRTPSPMLPASRLHTGCGPLNPQVRQVASRSNVASGRKAALTPRVLPGQSQTDSYTPEPVPPRSSSLGHRSVGHPVMCRS